MRLWSSWMISNSCDVSRKLFRAGRLGKEELGHFSGTRLLEVVALLALFYSIGSL